MSLQEKFLTHIKNHSLFNESEKILLAVSGGIDSMVMVDLFYKSGIGFGIAHCNFQLRRDESDDDEVFVKKQAKKYGVEIFTKRFDTKKFAKDKGISIQMAAREMRYRWMEEIATKHNFACCATAHHLNDSLETVIFNLAKGSGIAGLKGIPVKSGKIIRPLLFASKRDLIDYAETNSIEWREDHSNIDDKYTRNLIRNKIIPILEEINPNLLETYSYTYERILMAALWYGKRMEELKSDILIKKNKDIYIEKEKILQWEANSRPTLLFELLKPYHFNFHQVRNICESIMEVGKLFHSMDHTLNIDRNHLIISELTEQYDDIMINKGEKEVDFEGNKLHLEILPGRQEIIDDPSVAMVDFDKVRFPIMLRNWRPGDKFFPLGLGGEKKLSDFMIDEKIPLNLKKRVKVITSGNDVVWIVNYRIDERFKISEETRKILKIKYLKDE